MRIVREMVAVVVVTHRAEDSTLSGWVKGRSCPFAVTY